MQLPLRLRSALGSDTSAIDAAKITGLLGWREDVDLDFKQALDRTPKGRHGLVTDVVAMANARGGVIVVGIRESSNHDLITLPCLHSSAISATSNTTTSCPPRSNRRAMFDPILPSPTMPICNFVLLLPGVGRPRIACRY